MINFPLLYLRFNQLMQQPQCGRIVRCVIIFFVAFIFYIILIQRGFAQSPNAQNNLWLMASIGMFGDIMFPSLTGVPMQCGNANPEHTLSWMNPIDFNSTTIGHKVATRLRSPRRDAPVFVVGCGHSGTTELITLLDRHPLIYAYLDGPGMEFAIQPNSFDSPWGFQTTSRHDDRHFRRLAQENHATHWAVKSPSNICRIGYILRSLPQSRILMMIRDGRDTMMSLKARFPEADVSGPLVLRRWVNDNTAGLLYQRDPRLMMIKLEDLTQKPRDILPLILKHVGAPITYKDSASELFDVASSTSTSAELKSFYHAATKLDQMANDDLLAQLISPSPLHTNILNITASPTTSSPYDIGSMSKTDSIHSISSSNTITQGENQDHEPPSQKTKEKKKKKRSGWVRGASKSAALDEHDKLRKYQVSQPLNPMFPKWPTMMTSEDKAIFKADAQAMKLLIFFGYADDENW